MKILLINAFEKYSEKQLLLAGILFTIIGSSLAAFFCARYDGAIDLHFVEKLHFSQPFFDNLIAIACTTLALFVVGNYRNRKTRTIDILSAVMIARFPIYFLTFFNINGFIYKNTTKLASLQNPENLKSMPAMELLVAFGFGILALACIAWMFLLLWNGFKVATNAKGNNAILWFAIAILMAEVLSKILISII